MLTLNRESEIRSTATVRSLSTMLLVGGESRSISEDARHPGSNALNLQKAPLRVSRVARRSGFAYRMAQHQRQQEAQARALSREQMRALREAERAQKAYERAAAAEEKERRRLYLEARAAEVDAMNEQLDAFIASIENLLAATLDVDDFLDFDGLKATPEPLPFIPGVLATPEPAPRIERFMPPEPSGVGKFMPGAKGKYEDAVGEANAKFFQEEARHREREIERQRALDEARAEHEKEVAHMRERLDAQNAEIDAFRARFEAGDPEAVVEYFSLVLDASEYPEGFPKNHRIALVPESKQLVVEYQLPPVSIVPTTRLYRYVRSRDAIEESARPQAQVRALYAQIVAQTALRTMHELFEADRSDRVDTIVLNCFVDTVDAATGQPARPHLVTVRASKETFMRLDLAHVEPIACLNGLNAAISRRPHELLPVRPILEFDMVDPRFIQESDVLGELDDRLNLMELTPKEFESLISNLFQTMGLETRQTQASRDGGVDCVAYDPRPIFGGKVIIQAKRYKNTVGVSAVRDLFGTMQNEGASKGILVTTSGYGKSSFDFADGKPLELLSGSHLLFLLAEHADLEARIEPPEDWVDPIADVEESTVERPSALGGTEAIYSDERPQ
jgi:restriction system protein